MKKKVLVNLKIECELPHIPFWESKTLESRAKYLDEWARDFNDFIRDHRSQDRVDLSVERVFEDQCEFCNYEWEVDTSTGEPLCCQKAIDEFEAKKVTP